MPVLLQKRGTLASAEPRQLTLRILEFALAHSFFLFYFIINLKRAKSYHDFICFLSEELQLLREFNRKGSENFRANITEKYYRLQNPEYEVNCGS